MSTVGGFSSIIILLTKLALRVYQRANYEAKLINDLFVTYSRHKKSGEPQLF